MRKVFPIFLYLLFLSAAAQKPEKTDVHLVAQPDFTGKALVKWSITNESKLAVYVYDVFLWGPGEWNEQEGDVTILGTTPSREEPGCPNRVAPVLLLVIAPGRTIHGDFIDDRIKLAPKAKVVMRIAIFSNPYRVVEESKHFYESRCTHSPYDAIVREGTVVQSNVVQLPGVANPADTPKPR